MGFQRHANMTSAESGPDVTPKTESGRALLHDLRGSMYERLTDERTGTPIILAIEQEAASKAVAEVREAAEGLLRALTDSDDRPDDDVDALIWMRRLRAALIASERKP